MMSSTFSPSLKEAELLSLSKRVARSVSRPPGVMVEDAENDAVVAALRVAPDYPTTEASATVAFPNWIFTRVRGILLDQYGTAYRRQARCAVNPVDPSTLTNRPGRGADPADQAIAALDLREAIAKLPAKQRAAVTAVYLDGRTQEDVAAQLGVGQSAVSQLLDRARARLRDLLGEDFQ